MEFSLFRPSSLRWLFRRTRRRAATVALWLLVALPLQACLPKPAPEPLPPGPEWPAAVDPGRMAWQPRRMAGDEAARRALADVTPRLRRPGRAESAVQVFFSTPDLLTFRVGWTEHEWRVPVVQRWPQTFCMPFCEEEAGPPERVARHREQALVLPLDRVDDIRLYRLTVDDPTGGERTELRVRALHESGRVSELAAGDREAQTLLADALYTLSSARGCPAPSPARPVFSELPPDLAALLDLSGGALVRSWPLDPESGATLPAWPDVILTLDGRPATAALLETALRAEDAGADGPGPHRLTFLRWERYERSPRLRTRTLTLTWPQGVAAP